MAVHTIEQFHQSRDIGLQADPFAYFDEVLPPYFPVFGVVQQKVRQLSALLHQMDLGKTGHAVAEIGNAHHVCQYVTGIVKAQRLIEIADQKVAFRGSVEVCHIESPFSPYVKRLDRGRT